MMTVQGVWKKIPRRLRQKQRRRRNTPRRKRRRRTTSGERGDDFYARSFNVFVRMFQLFSFFLFVIIQHEAYASVSILIC